MAAIVPQRCFTNTFFLTVAYHECSLFVAYRALLINYCLSCIAHFLLLIVHHSMFVVCHGLLIINFVAYHALLIILLFIMH